MQRPGPRTTAGRGFAAKFYDILSQESSDIITWTESGQAFQVLDYTRFSEEILLKYFRHNKFSSFRRQLNLYGYRKVIKGPDAGAYMHPSFQRDRPDLLGEVKKGKVPHYDMHGVNEIHGQHFRHHPPGAKNKENAVRGKTPAQLSPVPHPKSAPIPPEVHGVDGYGTPHGAGVPMPAPHMTPGTQAAVAMSNMSLSPMPHPNNTWASPQNQLGMDALTLTPAWGGGGALAHDGNGGGESSKGNGGPEKPGGVGGGGASTASSGGGGGGGGVRMAYWEKSRKRRTMSAQLVFPVQPPENTENIDQPDPSLCDVMDVICQCMEVRNSSEESQQSQLSALSGCSFNMESLRRSSISDLLNCMSWESALRGSGVLRGSLAGAMDAAMMDGEQVGRAVSGGGGGGGGGSGSGSGGDNADNQPPLAPMFGHQASFDPTREPSGANSELMPGMMQPAVIAPSPVTSALGGPPGGGGGGGGGGQPEHRGDRSEEQQQQQQRRRQQKHVSRPSFDPNRESSIATGIRAAGQQSSRINGQGGGAGGGRANTVGSVGVGGAHPGGVSRETSRGSTAARIFNSVPVRSPTPGGGAADATGYHQAWANGGRESSGESVATAPPDGSSVHWVMPSGRQQSAASAASAAAATTTTSSTWGMSQPQGPRGGQGDLGGLGDAQVVASPRSSSAASSPSAQARGAQVFSRPALGRMGSLQWLTEPTASRRPTINETQEVNRLLANPEHFAAWTRVAEDPDTMYLAKSIGDFLG